MKAPSEGMLQKTQGSLAMEACWVWFLCLPQLLAVCDGSTSSSPLAQHREFHISGSFPEHIFACHSQEVRPEHFMALVDAPAGLAPLGPAVQLGSAGVQQRRKAMWLGQESE